MEDSRTEERKNFMKRKSYTFIWAIVLYSLCFDYWSFNSLLTIASFQDPLKKREQFAVSLRKQKTNDIINAKRRKLMGGFNDESHKGEENMREYRGVKMFEEDPNELSRQLNELCPEILNEAKA